MCVCVQFLSTNILSTDILTTDILSTDILSYTPSGHIIPMLTIKSEENHTRPCETKYRSAQLFQQNEMHSLKTGGYLMTLHATQKFIFRGLSGIRKNSTKTYVFSNLASHHIMYLYLECMFVIQSSFYIYQHI